MLARGVNASPGAAKGEVVFTAADAVAAEQDGRDVILVRPFTEADDVAGFDAAQGILTSEGGKASHAALVARGMGRPAVVGASALAIDLKARTITVDGTKVSEGDRIAIDGTKGCVTLEDVPLVDPEERKQLDAVAGAIAGTRAAFPLARVVALAECGTHAILDAEVALNLEPEWERGRDGLSAPFVAEDADGVGRGRRDAPVLADRDDAGLDELAQLGRTLHRRRHDVLAYFDHHASNGPTEAINGRLEALRRNALGFRNLTHYRIRSLLHCGNLTQQIDAL